MKTDHLMTFTAASTGVASLWPIGHAAFLSWPTEGVNGPGLGVTYLLGVVGCAGLVSALTMLLLRAFRYEHSA